MKAKSLLVAVFCISLSLPLGSAFGDGGVFIRRPSYTYADVFQPTQKVYIRWDGSQEKLLIQTKYEGPAEEMVWIVPVPSQPTVEKADGSIFQDLSKETLDPAIDCTDFLGLDMSAWTTAGGITSGSDTSVVEWYERIGDFDVALLRPVGGEDVNEWLNANGFATPEAINPVLADYVHAGWWMVAAKIAPEALTPITRDKLAKGTLHPLEMTFRSSACVYPMRLTRLVAGPVEELIYIEGPHHYEPATLAEGNWEITLFGGPVRTVPQDYRLSDMEYTLEIVEGRAQTEVKSCLTKLRRVFEPSEMTEDIVFRKLDLAQWLASKDLTPPTPPITPPDQRPDPRAQAEFERQVAGSAPVRIAQAATQYGRWRDPNGISPLVNALSAEALDKVIPPTQDFQPWPSPSAKFLFWWGTGKWSPLPTKEGWAAYPGCTHLRSCIWALGEIGVEHEIGQAAEEKLLECAHHDNEIIRMEAYVALTKVHSEGLGAFLIGRLTDVLCSGPWPVPWWPDFRAVAAELDVATDWILYCGAPEQRDAWIDMLRGFITGIDPNTLYDGGFERSVDIAWYWPEWIVWCTARTQDARLLPALEGLHARLSPEKANTVGPFLARVEAACGSADASAAVVRQVLDREAQILSAGQAPGTGGIMSLDNLYYSSIVPQSLRVRVLQRRGLACALFPMPIPAADATMRRALADETINDWYTLYLLTGIKKPQACDKEKLLRLWDSRDTDHRLLAIDVVYVWGDKKMLMDLYVDAEFAKVKSEIAWALAALKIVEGDFIIEEQVRDSWNADWLSLGKTFIHPDGTSRRGWYATGTLPMETGRNEQALWNYFHPISGILDDARLAILKRLTTDRTIHAGMRFDLLGKDYGGTDWGLPLLEQAARDILAADSSDATKNRINSMMKAVGNSGFAIDPPSD